MPRRDVCSMLARPSALIPNARSQFVRVKRFRYLVFGTCIHTVYLPVRCGQSRYDNHGDIMRHIN